MEKFVFGQNNNESLLSELLDKTESFIKDSRLLLTTELVSIEIINKLLEAISTYRDTLLQMTPKSNDEDTKIKSTLQDLDDLEITCNKRKTLH